MKEVDSIITIDPTLFIGLGGQGCRLVNLIKKIAVEKYSYVKDNRTFPLVKFLAIDTDPHIIDSIDHDDGLALTSTECIFLSADQDINKIIKNPEHLECGEEHFIDSRISEIIKIKGQGCGGWPIICKILGLKEIKKLKTTLDNLLRYLTNIDELNQQLFQGAFNERYSFSRNQLTVHIFILCSLGGGTARGLYELIALLVKFLGKKYLKDPDTQMKIRLVNIFPSAFKIVSSQYPYEDYPRKNQYTAFREIDYFLSHGYEIDKCLKRIIKEIIKIEEDLDKRIKILDHVYNISASNEYGPVVSDERSLFNFIAQYFADTTFLGFFSQLTGQESNYSSGGTFIREIESGKERIRGYGRIAFYKIIFPTEDVAEYISYRLIDNLIRDLRRGFIIAKSDKEINEERERYLKKTVNVDIVFQEKINYNSQITEYDDPQWYDPLNIIEQKLEDLSKKFIHLSEISEGNLSQWLEELKKFLVELVKSNGLETAKKELENIKRPIVSKIAKILDKDVREITKELKNKLLNKEIEEFKEKCEKQINDLRKTIENTRREIKEKLQEVEKKRSFLAKLTFDKTVPQEIRNELFKKIEMCITNWEKCNFEFNECIKLVLLVNFFDKIEIILNIIEDNLLLLQRYSDELSEKVKKIIQRVPSGFIRKMFLLNKKEGDEIYKYFNDKNLFAFELIYAEKINEEDWIKDLITEKIKLDEDSEIKKSLNQIKQEVKNKVKKAFKEKESIGNPIIYYFNRILNNKNFTENEKIKQIEEIIENWLQIGEFVAPLQKIEAGITTNLDEFTSYLIFLPRKVFEDDLSLYKYIENIAQRIVSKRGGKISIISNPDKNIQDEIIILGLQPNLSFFLFKEAKDLRLAYFEIQNPIEKIARHNSKYYISFEEPIGKDIVVLNQKDLNYYLNLAYQLKAIKGSIKSIDDVLKVFSREGVTWDYNPVKDKNGKEITAYYFYKNWESFPEVIEKIQEAIKERYYCLFKCAFDFLKDDLSKFLCCEYYDKGYIPLSPSIINILKKDFSDDIKFVSFLDKYNKIDIEKFEKIKNEIGENVYAIEEDLKRAGFKIIDISKSENIDLEKTKEVSICDLEETYIILFLTEKEGKKIGKILLKNITLDEIKVFLKEQVLSSEPKYDKDNIYIFKGTLESLKNMPSKERLKHIHHWEEMEELKDLLEKVEENEIMLEEDEIISE